MGHNITETATWDTPVVVPDDGDDETATAAPYPIDAPLQSLTDRALYLRTAWASIGSPFVGLRRYVTSGGQLWAPPISNITAAGLTLENATEVAAPSVSGTAWEVLYLYAYVSSGSLAFEISATVPDAFGYFKNNDASRRFMGSIQLNGSGAAIPGTYRDGFMLYDQSGMTLDTTRVLASGVSTSFAAVQCHVPIPISTGKAGSDVFLGVTLVNSSGSSQNAFFQRNGASGSDYYVVSVGANQTTWASIWQTADLSGNIAYQVSAGTLAVTLDVLGWREYQ